MSRTVKKIAPVVGAVAGSFIPGVGPILGPAIGGAIGGAVSGQGAKGIGLGALGGATFGAAPALAGASGLGNLGMVALRGGLQGAALGGLAGGDLKSALTGAALGSSGGYLSAGGAIPGLGSLGGRLGAGGMGPPTPGSGILGGLGSLTGGAAGGGQAMRLGSLLNTGINALGYVQGDDDIEDIQNILARQSQQAQAQFQPYSQAGQQALQNMQAPSMEALQADPGYQFQLQQGQQALERSLAARGLGQSGAALKAAQEYGQGLANQTYDDYFNRQALLANQGFGAAQGLGSLYTNLGNVQAAAELERINQRNNLLSGLGGLFR